MKHRLLLVLSFLVGFGTHQLLNPSSTPLSRCVEMFSNNPELKESDPAIQEVLKKEGLTSLQDLIAKRCKTWIDNGQRF